MKNKKIVKIFIWITKYYFIKLPQNFKTMKKLILSVGATLILVTSVNATSRFQIDEKKLESLIVQSSEMSVQEIEQSFQNTIEYKHAALNPEQTRGGYLLRAFFCGGIALHRYYMGTNQKWMWAMYFCIPVVGGVTSCVDFWGAVFDKDFYLKYKNNDKYIVWLD